MLSYKDVLIDLDKAINGNAIVTIVFGNLALAALLILVVIMVVEGINDTPTSRFLYSFIAIFGCLLVMAKVIKSQYNTRNEQKMDSQFSEWMQSNAESPAMIPSGQKNGSADPYGDDFARAELIESVEDVDVDNFLFN